MFRSYQKFSVGLMSQLRLNHSSIISLFNHSIILCVCVCVCLCCLSSCWSMNIQSNPEYAAAPSSLIIGMHGFTRVMVSLVCGKHLCSIYQNFLPKQFFFQGFVTNLLSSKLHKMFAILLFLFFYTTLENTVYTK